MRRRLSLVVVLAAGVVGLGDAARADGEVASDAHVFFREPDKETAGRIADLMSRVAADSVQGRARARRELAAIGWWSVDPLTEAARNADPGVRCASILVLDAIRDRRAIEPLRTVVLEEDSHPYVAAFAALALGRFRDPGAVEPFRAALRTSKTMELLKAAVPLALARIRTPAAHELLLDRVRASSGKEQPVRNAALLSLGFFPESALDPSGARPSAELAAGLANRQRRGERESALLAFLVASASRAPAKPFLLDVFASEGAHEVAGVALLGLSRSGDADVTELLAKTAARQGDDRIRILAADLLHDRADAAVKPLLMQVVRTASSPRLRATSLLALGRLDDEDARRLVLEKMTDPRSPLVRAAAAIALTRRPPAGAAAREALLATVESRVRTGETNDDVRANLEKARAVLAGDRTDVRWTEVGSDVLFAELGLSYEQRLLRAVNRRVQICLDLGKIHNLQNDAELVTVGPPTRLSDPGDGDAPNGDGDPGAGDGEPGPPDGPDPPGEGPGLPGAQRTSQWQELRDLKVELIRDPYFGPADLPLPPTTPAGKPRK